MPLHRKRTRGYCGCRQLVREDVGPRIRAAVEHQACARERIEGRRARRDTGIAPIKQRAQPPGPPRRLGHQVHRPAAARSHAVRDPDAARGSRGPAPRPSGGAEHFRVYRDWRLVAAVVGNVSARSSLGPFAWLQTCCNAYKKLQHRHKRRNTSDKTNVTPGCVLVGCNRGLRASFRATNQARR
jgi:hypothetical protein